MEEVSTSDQADPPLAAASPVARAQRIASLDLIRGIAVLGILLANITAFAHGDLAYFWPPAIQGGANEGDLWVWLAQFVLIDGKFRGIFTMLFGAGMLLFIDRVGDFDRALKLQFRRLVWLVVFGVLHFFFLFQGDILFSYGCAGLLGLFCVRLEARQLIMFGAIWLTVAALMDLVTYLPYAQMEMAAAGTDGGSLTMLEDFWGGEVARGAYEAQLYAGDSYAAILSYRFAEQYSALASYFAFAFFETIPLAMVGMGFYRAGVFSRAEVTAQWRGLAIIALFVGMAMNLAAGLFAWSHGFSPYVTQLAFFGLLSLGNVPMLLGGMVLLARWASRAGDGWLVERLSAAGRMAFTNYVGTSVLMVLIFHGWAGGLFGTLHRLEMLPVVALGWALMIGFSRFWLARFRYGPLEYVWRCLTYWQVFALRR